MTLKKALALATKIQYGSSPLPLICRTEEFSTVVNAGVILRAELKSLMKRRMDTHQVKQALTLVRQEIRKHDKNIRI